MNLSSKIIAYWALGGILLFLGGRISERLQWGSREALADALGTFGVAATCQAAPVQAWTSNIHYDISWSDAVASRASAPEVNVSLDNPIQGDRGELLSQNFLLGEGHPSRLLMVSPTPTYKMTGLLCRPYFQAHVNSYAGVEGGNLDVSFDDARAGLKGFNDRYRVDLLDAQNSLTLVGNSGVTKNGSMADGSDIGANRPDGQIIIGGSDAGLIKTILNLRASSQNISQPIVLSMQAF